MCIAVLTENVSKNRYIFNKFGYRSPVCVHRTGRPVQPGWIFLKNRLQPNNQVCQVFIVAGCWFIIYWKAINGRCMDTLGWFSLYIPKIQMPENFSDHIFIIDKCNHPHFRSALGADERIDFPGSGPGQAPRKYRRRILGMLNTTCRCGTALTTSRHNHSQNSTTRKSHKSLYFGILC